MDSRINIAVIEPSLIIYEGLSGILLQSCNHYHIYRFENIEEYFSKRDDIKIDAIIVNPQLLNGDIKRTIHNINIDSSLQCIALLYSFCEREVISLFDGVIQITDPLDVIVNSVSGLLHPDGNFNKIQQKEQLTIREIEIIKNIAKGLSNKEMADALNISTHTVISHRKNIVQKTGIKSQAGLTIYAITNHIIDIDNIRE